MPREPEVKYLPAHFLLEHALREQLGTQPGQQRVIDGDGELLLVAHEAPEHGSTDPVVRLFWRTREGRWLGEATGSGIEALTGLLDGYARIVASLRERLAQAASARDLAPVLRHSSAVLEATRDLAAAVQGAAELTHDDRAILDARDRAMAMERTAELLAADARNLLDIRQAEQSELQTAALERLSFNLFRLCLLVACLLPPAVLAGWCALNRQSPSWLADIYWWLAGGVAMLAGVLLWLTARRQRK